MASLLWWGYHWAQPAEIHGLQMGKFNILKKVGEVKNTLNRVSYYYGESLKVYNLWHTKQEFFHVSNWRLEKGPCYKFVINRMTRSGTHMIR